MGLGDRRIETHPRIDRCRAIASIPGPRRPDTLTRRASEGFVRCQWSVVRRSLRGWFGLAWDNGVFATDNGQLTTRHGCRTTDASGWYGHERGAGSSFPAGRFTAFGRKGPAEAGTPTGGGKTGLSRDADLANRVFLLPHFDGDTPYDAKQNHPQWVGRSSMLIDPIASGRRRTFVGCESPFGFQCPNGGANPFGTMRLVETHFNGSASSIRLIGGRDADRDASPSKTADVSRCLIRV